jgi:diguanylate cyclase (GGDEF)-like protein
MISLGAAPVRQRAAPPLGEPRQSFTRAPGHHTRGGTSIAASGADNSVRHAGAVMSNPQDKAMDLLLELGNPAERRTRARLLSQALNAVVKLMEADAAVIATPWSRRGERLALHTGSAAPAALPMGEAGSAVIRALAETCEPLAVADLSEGARFSAGDACPGVEAGPVLFTPLRQRGLAPAYIAAYRRRGRARFNMADTRIMLLLGTWLGVALDNLRLATGAERLAVTDEVTDVYNQRFLKAALQREIRRASRFAQALSLVVVDTDQLEALSAEHGEVPASVLLRELALVLGAQVRSFDVLGRRGDGGFVLILPQTDRDGATEVGERMRDAVARHAFSVAPAGITVSVGVASFPGDAAEPADLMGAAKRALDQARQQGGNRVEVPKRRRKAA